MPNLQRAELLALLREAADVTLAFDTNAIFGDSKKDPFIAICDAINVLNASRPGHVIRNVISTPVYVEKVSVHQEVTA